jgi:hypothetical protein
MEKRRAWFRHQPYNRGLYPATIEGWLVVVLWLLILVGSTMVLLAAMLYAVQPYTTILFVLWGAVVAADTAMLAYVRHIKGPHPRKFRTLYHGKGR